MTTDNSQVDGLASESRRGPTQGARILPLSECVYASEDLPFPATGHGLTWRGLRRSDLEALLELERAVDAVDDPESATDLEELEERFDAPGFDAARDSVIAFEPGGAAVAHGEAYLESSGEAIVTVHVNGQVRPDWRRRGVGTAVLRWQQGRGLQHLASTDLRLPGMLSTLVGEQAEGRRALLEGEGFAPVRWWIGMERDLDLAIPDIDMGADLRVEGYTPRWSESAREVINEAFRDHWGSQPTSREEWEAAKRSDEFRAEWSAVAIATLVDGTETVVGAITVESDEEEWDSHGYRFGDVDELGVVRAWRGRGVARALLAWSMREMRDAGMARTSLDVDSESPTGAHALYERLGFRAVGRSVTYAKTY